MRPRSCSSRRRRRRPRSAAATPTRSPGPRGGAGPRIRVAMRAVASYLETATGTFDLVFIDPPYDLGDRALAHDLALLAPLLSPDAVVVVERSSRSPEPRWPAGIVPERRRDYGETTLWWASGSARAAVPAGVGVPPVGADRAGRRRGPRRAPATTTPDDLERRAARRRRPGRSRAGRGPPRRPARPAGRGRAPPPSKSRSTPLASAMRRASRASPSETSSIAVAPARAATTPAATGGSGASWAPTSSRMPRPHVGRPCGVGLARGIRALVEEQREPPGRVAAGAGVRHDVARARTGAQHGRAALEVAERGDRDREHGRRREVAADHAGARARVPRAPRAARRRCPRAPSRGVVGGAAIATTSAVGRAPIAATSVRFVAAAFQPRSNGVDQASRKSGPCTSRSVVTTNRPSAAATTAASSPAPRSAASPGASRGRMRREHRRFAQLGDRRVAGARSSFHATHGSLNGMPHPDAPLPRRGLRRVASAAGLAVLGSLALAGCSQAVAFDAAPSASDPDCAAVVVRLPDTVAGLRRARDQRAGHGRVGAARLGAAALRRRAARPDDRPVRERRRRRLGHRRIGCPELPVHDLRPHARRRGAHRQRRGVGHARRSPTSRRPSPRSPPRSGCVALDDAG